MYEMKEMEIRGISAEGQREILNCIEDVDYISAAQLEEIKEWLKGELQKSIEENSLERKNTSESAKSGNNIGGQSSTTNLHTIT